MFHSKFLIFLWYLLCEIIMFSSYINNNNNMIIYFKLNYISTRITKVLGHFNGSEDFPFLNHRNAQLICFSLFFPKISQV